MAWQWTPYTIPLVVAATLSAISALYILRHRHTASSRTGVLLLLAAAEWMIGYALELASVNLSAKLFWAEVKFVAICIIPTVWLVYTLQYTGREKWLTRRTLALLSIVPLIMLLLVFTNDAHGLIWHRVWLDTDGPFSVKCSVHGVGVWVYIIYSYILVLVSIFLLIQALVHSGHLYRWQAGTLLLAVFAVWLANAVVDVFGWNPLPNLELTPLALGLTVPVIAWSLYRLRRLDIVPVAREAVLEGMSDGVVVLDAQNRIVDLNSAAQHLVGHTRSEAIGQPLEQVWPEWPGQMELPRDGTETSKEVVLGQGDEQCTYDVRISPLTDWRGRLASQVIVLRDITERRRAEDALRRAEAETRKRLKEQTALREAGAVITSTLDLAEVLSRIAEQMCRAIDATSAYICSIELETRTSTMLAEYFSPHACAQEKVSDLGVTYVEGDVEIEIEFLEAMRAGKPDISHIDAPDLPKSERAHMQQYGGQTILYIPLLVKGQFLGFAELWESQRRREFTPEEIALCQDIAQQAAIALENARLFEGERRQRQVAETLLDTSAALTSSLDLGQVLLTLGGRLLDISGFHSCVISEWDREAGQVRALMERARAIWSPGSEDTYHLSDYPTTERVLLTGKPAALYVGMADADEAELALMREQGFGALMMLPLRSGEETIGLVEIGNSEDEFASDGAAVLRCQQVLQEAASWLISPLRANSDAALLALAGRLVEAGGGSSCSISAWCQPEEEVRSVVECKDTIWASEGPSYRLAASTLARTLEKGMSSILRLSDPTIDPVDRDELARWGMRMTVLQPLSIKGKPIGLVELHDMAEERVISEDELRLWRAVADQAAVAIQNARLYEQAQQEITERVRAEERIKASLQEKEVLLKEIHHRVKNNLQVMSSLLYLQAKNMKDEEALEMFQESQNRVRSMALVHEKLYQSQDLARIDFSEYIRGLANYLFQSYGVSTSVIQLKINADDILLDIDTAVPCGLMLNELVSNSLKHAFPAGREGEIRIEFRVDKDHQFTLMVSDNGVGFPRDLGFRDTQSLGLQLVNTLVDQLEGTIALDRSGGTAFKITFAELRNKGRG